MKVQIADQTFTVEPVRVKDLPRFLAAVEPIAQELAGGDIAAAIMRQADRIIEATAIGAGVERSWLESQTTEVLIELASAVLEENVDFFVRVVLPRLTAATEKLAKIVSGGTSGSPGSAQQAWTSTR